MDRLIEGMIALFMVSALLWASCDFVERKAKAAPASKEEVLWVHDCANCHGFSGKGDGYYARFLPVAPADFTKSTWQIERSDDRLKLAIRYGGVAVGKSPSMPAHRDLTPDELLGLVQIIRSFDEGPINDGDNK